MADHDQPTPVVPEELAQPHDGVGVEVVGGLVEQEGLRPGEQDPGQFDASALATTQRPQRLSQDPVLDAQAAGDLGGLGLGGVPTAGVQLGVGTRIALHRPLRQVGVPGPHLGLGLTQASYDVVEAACGEDPVAREHLGIADAGVLGQVAHVTGPEDLTRGRQGFAGQDPGQGCLSRPVAADQADLVAGRDPEADVLHQQARPGTDLEVLGGDHEGG